MEVQKTTPSKPITGESNEYVVEIIYLVFAVLVSCFFAFRVSVKPSVPVSNNILHLKSLQQVTIRVRFFMFDHRGKQIYLICGSTDMSKGIDGLSSIVDRKR